MNLLLHFPTSLLQFRAVDVTAFFWLNFGHCNVFLIAYQEDFIENFYEFEKVFSYKKQFQ